LIHSIYLRVPTSPIPGTNVCRVVTDGYRFGVSWGRMVFDPARSRYRFKSYADDFFTVNDAPAFAKLWVRGAWNIKLLLTTVG
jgi:hypothetical protein